MPMSPLPIQTGILQKSNLYLSRLLVRYESGFSLD